MQSADTGSHIAKRTFVSPNQHRRAAYSKVVDKRKRPIRGLWEGELTQIKCYRGCSRSAAL